jgi:hypothetical protein
VNITNRIPLTADQINNFLSSINFKLPEGYIEFLKIANGAEIYFGVNYLRLFPLNDIIQWNKDYEVDIYAPDYFLVGSDGGGNAFFIERKSGKIFQIPFEAMSEAQEYGIHVGDNFDDFLLKLGRNTIITYS